MVFLQWSWQFWDLASTWHTSASTAEVKTKGEKRWFRKDIEQNLEIFSRALLTIASTSPPSPPTPDSSTPHKHTCPFIQDFANHRLNNNRHRTYSIFHIIQNVKRPRSVIHSRCYVFKFLVRGCIPKQNELFLLHFLETVWDRTPCAVVKIAAYSLTPWFSSALSREFSV